MDQFLQEHIYSLVHWPWLAVCIIFMICGQVTKTSVFTKKRAYTKGKMQWLRWWGWKTLPLHPIITGVVVGYFWSNPEPGITSTAASMAYFGSAGALSVWAYQVLKGIAKKRHIELPPLPGQQPSEKPPPKTSVN